MTRADADLELVRGITATLPEFTGLIGRLRRDQFLSNNDYRVILEARELLKDAAGRLTLRTEEARQ